MTSVAPHPEPVSSAAGARRAPRVAAPEPGPGPGFGGFAPPAGPRLDRAPGSVPGPVDWWAWQARVRVATGSRRVVVRPAPAAPWTRLRAVALVSVLGVGAIVAAGLTLGGRSAGEVAAAATGPLPPTADARVAATPLAMVGVSDLPPPPEPEPEPAPAVLPRLRLPVARTTVDLVDPSRPAVARGDAAAAAGRLLRTEVRYPADGRDGGYPLVVFAHGYATSTAAYGPLLDDLAAAGYVVAAPELPATSTAHGATVGGRQPAEQVDDVRFVISAVTMVAAGDGPLRGAVREGSVVVIGHSDGGITAAAAAFSGAVRDDRIGAAVVLSGARLSDGSVWFPPGAPALLAVHGDADAVNPLASSQGLYAADRSGSPRYLVQVRDAGHTDAFVGARTRPALVDLIDDFVRASLGTDPAAAARIPAGASVPGVLDLLGSG